MEGVFDAVQVIDEVCDVVFVSVAVCEAVEEMVPLCDAVKDAEGVCDTVCDRVSVCVRVIDADTLFDGVCEDVKLMVTVREGEDVAVAAWEAVGEIVREGESCEFRQSPDGKCFKTPPAKIILCLDSLLLHGATVMSEPLTPGFDTVKHQALDNPVENPLGLSATLHKQRCHRWSGAPITFCPAFPSYSPEYRYWQATG